MSVCAPVAGWAQLPGMSALPRLSDGGACSRQYQNALDGWPAQSGGRSGISPKYTSSKAARSPSVRSHTWQRGGFTNAGSFRLRTRFPAGRVSEVSRGSTSGRSFSRGNEARSGGLPPSLRAPGSRPIAGLPGRAGWGHSRSATGALEAELSRLARSDGSVETDIRELDRAGVPATVGVPRVGDAGTRR